MMTAYVASPQCRERGCVIFSWNDELSFRKVYQHGDNPEAVVFIDMVAFTNADQAAKNARQQFREFAERCHQHADGVRP